VFKAKYPRESFPVMKIGFQPSWRSVFKAREVLGEGMRWNISHKEKVRVWSDCWLPITNSGQAFTLPTNLDLGTHVLELID